jgi:hypothetical protein
VGTNFGRWFETAAPGSSLVPTGNEEVVIGKTGTVVGQIVGHIAMRCIPCGLQTGCRGFPLAGMLVLITPQSG